MGQPYTVPADGADVFRTFVLPIPTDRIRATCEAIEFRPGTPASCTTPTSESTARARHVSSTHGIAEPGYVGGMVQDARYPEGHMLGWTPGQTPQPVARRHAVAARTGERSRRPAAPAADRQARRRSRCRVGVLLHRQPRRRARRSAFRLGSETIDIPPATATIWCRIATSCRSTSSCSPFSRMRTTSRDAWRRTPRCRTAPSRPLIAIADWDFRWQDVYRYAAPVALPRGDRRSRCGTPTTTPRPTRAIRTGRPRGSSGARTRRTRWATCGCRSCPASARFRAAEQEFDARRDADDLAAYTKLLQGDPDNPLRHDAVGDLYLQAGSVDEAIERVPAIARPQSGVGARRTTTSAIAIPLRGRRRGRDRAASKRPCDSIPTTPRRTTILARSLPRAALATRRSSITGAPLRLRPDNVDSRTTSGCCFRPGASG